MQWCTTFLSHGSLNLVLVSRTVARIRVTSCQLNVVFIDGMMLQTDTYIIQTYKHEKDCQIWF